MKPQIKRSHKLAKDLFKAISKIEIKKYFETVQDSTLKYPLNIKFKCKIKKLEKKNLTSNGIYFIIEKETNKIIYIGINLSKDLKNKNFVDEQRIVKHLQSLTMRGSQVGLSSNINSWFSKCYRINNHLYSLRQNIPNKDTGTTSDPNRLSYANINWGKFSVNDNFSKILNEQFYVYYFKINFFDQIMKEIFVVNINVSISKNKFRKKIEKYFEEPLINEYKPFIHLVKKSKKYPFQNENWTSKFFDKKKVLDTILKLISNYNNAKI